MAERSTRPGPRTFAHFPDDLKCPICDTNDDGVMVLIPIAGTEDGNNMQAQPMHLGCAVIRQWDEGMQMGICWPHRRAT